MFTSIPTLYSLFGEKQNTIQGAISRLEKDLEKRRIKEISRKVESLTSHDKEICKKIYESEERSRKTTKKYKVKRDRSIELWRLHFQLIRLIRLSNKTEEEIYSNVKIIIK